MELRENTVLDNKYRLGRIIGQGGMGIVYEAIHVTIGRKFAVKCLHRQLAEDSRAVLRFQQEAKLAGTIGHDNICEVTDFGITDDGIPYLVMPLLVGASLDTLFNTEIISLHRLADIARQTLSALNAAFESNIVHRDLKPDNIFITKVGDRPDFVKLLDFGISKVLNSEVVMHLTQTGNIVGTAQYMSPEQAAGSLEVDQRTDLYALGVILYEGLTGRCPFDGESYNEIMFHIINDSFPMPRSLNPAIPPLVERVVLKAMARDPAARYSNPAEMDAALFSAIREITPKGTPAAILSNKTRFGNSRLFAPASSSDQLTLPALPKIKAEETPPTPVDTGTDNRRPSQAASGPRFKSAGPAITILLLLALTAVALFVFLGQQKEAPVVVPLQPDASPSPPPAVAPAAETHVPALPPLNPDLLPNKKQLAADKPLLEPEGAVSSRAPTVANDKASAKPGAKTENRKPAPETPDHSPQDAPSSSETGIVKRGITFEVDYQ